MSVGYTNEELVEKMIANSMELRPILASNEMAFKAGYLESFLINMLYRNEELLKEVIDTVDYQNNVIERRAKQAANKVIHMGGFINS